MILLIGYVDGTEESFEVGERTNLRTLQNRGYWKFTTLDGGQVAIGEDIVSRIQIGRVHFETADGHLNADAGSDDT